ncbi:hypothetical protein CLU83_1666 [Flavobacterium sp. 1]|uniref:hypothetical protein n=1 Tax=Flavobacterium sp. 1 TaxID=2035200 RepID=UPI000C24CC60|nr:hypothetical protein [Flavobacterium sp. 1]PJJ08399.1 hypothetical protein CLU83_1666 [Flavobacterium sp. 1]
MKINLKTKSFFTFLSVFLLSYFANAQYQWSVPITQIISNETKGHPQAFLWIPENCKQVRAVVLGQHNMTEETIFDHPQFRKTMAKLGIAIVWVSPGFSMNFDPNTDAGKLFKTMMTDLASVSGYKELQFVPAIPIGHSAYATYPWNFAASNPDRTLAIISIHGDAPQTKLTGYGGKNIDWNTKNIDGIPGLMVEGEYEWWEARVQPALDFKQRFPNSAISFLCDAGHGHFDISNKLIDYLNLFIKKAIENRLPQKMPLDKPIRLRPIVPQEGWLKERWKKDTKPTFPATQYNVYQGDKKEAFWYFDKEMAKATEQFYSRERSKKEQYLGFIQNGKLLPFNPKSHARIVGSFTPETDGLSFHLKSVFTDTLRTKTTNDHAKGNSIITRICGPVEKVNDTTFTIRFYRMGLNNEKRTGDIWLMASHAGDRNYKSTVQQFNMRIPLRNTEGMQQKITFEPIENQKTGTKKITLKAHSNSQLPIYFYIQEGPAEIKNGKLVITKIPKRTKFPLKVTVVAWQYGRSIEPKIQSAEPVVQSFYLSK